MRRLAEVAVRSARKRRSDAGQVTLTLADAQYLSAVMMEGFRANSKSILSLREALVKLRANHPGFACALDAETGELAPLSESACARALRYYSLHPDQLRQTAPAQQLASDHPNDVWQIDASISTLFYVPEEGLADMAPGEFYKNKPGNFERIKRQRLTRYVLTDHCSGSIFVHYVAGGESIVNMAEAFLAAIAPRPQAAMHGVPFHLMMDPGSAGTAGAFGNLLRRLQVMPVVNQAGNPRAKGQVENAHNLVETNFESGFKFVHVPDIAWINDKAQAWMRYYNSTKQHSRHGMTRWAKWREIKPEQLRLVDAALARELLTHAPQTPKGGYSYAGALCRPPVERARRARRQLRREGRHHAQPVRCRQRLVGTAQCRRPRAVAGRTRSATRRARLCRWRGTHRARAQGHARHAGGDQPQAG
jgi:hypothetical protein